MKLALRALAFVTVLVGAATQVACSSTAQTAKADKEAQALRDEATPERLEATGDRAVQLGDLTRAEQYYTAALKQGQREGHPRERVLTQKLVAVCAEDGRYPAAIQYATDYLNKHPGDVDMRFAAAALASAIGDHEAARMGFERVLALRPSNAEAHFALASLLQDEGDDGAQAHFRTYLSLAPRGAFAESARAALLKSMSLNNANTNPNADANTSAQ